MEPPNVITRSSMDGSEIPSSPEIVRGGCSSAPTSTAVAVPARRVGNSLVSEQEDNGDDEGDVQITEVDSVDQPVVSSSAALVESPAQIPQDDDDDDHDEAEPEVADDDEEEDESDYEYEEEDDTHYAGFVEKPDLHYVQVVERPAAVASATASSSWKEPSREAVNMSLRAEKETTGGKRRLASDLYKIMMADTKEAGFSLQPKSEDSMDKWTIKLFQFDSDSNLHKDMVSLGVDHIELEMSFPDQYPFSPPFVRVVRPRFQRQTGFVMNGALCMELLTNEGWNPVNDIESVIVSIRSLLVVGDGRLEGAQPPVGTSTSGKKRARDEHYSMAEAKAAYSHLSDYHKKKGWDSSGWWARKG